MKHWTSGLSGSVSRYILCMLALSVPVAADEPRDAAWHNFQHAVGEAPMIGANADHELSEAVWRPVPAPPPGARDTARFRLGSALFHEGRLSSANSVACVTCHAGALSGADRRRVSRGVGGAPGTKNALSVFNAAFNFRQFWDGRAVTLEDQALEPIENPVEMAHTLEAVLEMLRDDPAYTERFEAVYPDGVTINNLSDALAHFQRINFLRLDTPFQRYLNGDEAALGEQEKRGMQRFREVGCAGCHNGINLGGNSYQRLGSAIPYYDADRQASPEDTGVMEHSGRVRDRHVFKVPGLHGVATTPPYFHDGSVATLEEAITLMARHQLGRVLSRQETADIEAFLRSLGGHFGRARGAPDDTVDPAETAAFEPSPSSHEAAYQAAIRSLAMAGDELLKEAVRIHEGEVAHFDFLQRRHLDMIRYARALHHPPSSLTSGMRTGLVEVAQDTLEQVSALEWLIADFLRAEAMIDVFEAHRDTPAADALPAGAGDPSARLEDHRLQAREAMAAIEAARPRQAAAAIQALYAEAR